MFGYVTPDKPYLLIKDYALYRSVYCGLCKSTKTAYGNIPRLTTNYDSVFLSILLHNYLNVDYKLERKRCILHPLKKRHMADNDDITKKVVTLSILLTYHKFTDDIIDGGGAVKRAARSVIVKRAYKKAKALMPEADRIISDKYGKLRQLEKAKERSIDRVSDCFASMMEELCKSMLLEKSDEHMERLFYNVGKWIYLIDALDDLEKDKKTGNYNPLIAAYGEFDSVEKFKADIKDRAMFTFNCIFNALKKSLESLTFNFNTDILKNIMLRGITTRTNMILESNCKCKKIRI